MKKSYEIIVVLLGLGLMAYAIHLAYAPTIMPKDGIQSDLPPFSGISNNSNNNGEVDLSIPTKVTLRGSFICLPHTDQTGPTTLECAYGIKDESGNNYALDLGLLESSESRNKIESGQQVEITGILVRKEALNSDMWQKYTMVGIIQVTSVK